MYLEVEHDSDTPMVVDVVVGVGICTVTVVRIKLLKEGVEHIDLKGVEFGETEFNGIKTLTRCFIFGETTVAAQGHNVTHVKECFREREKKRSKVDLVVVPVSGRRVCARAVAGTAVLSYKSFLKASLSYLPTFALSDLWLRPNPWCMAWEGFRRWRGGSFRLRFDSGRGRLLQLRRRRRWRLFLLHRRRFCLREEEAYLAPSSPSCLRRVEATVAPRCRFGTRRKFGVGGPDESAVFPMTLSVEDHREGRCFVAGYEIRRNEARWLRRRLEAETVRLRRCATRVDLMAQMPPRVQQPASSTRLIQPTSFGLVWFGPRAVYSI
ncbi:LOW QUALITY PROTEIN: hypothetical protein HID58_006076 [Brassica napus]|uniref:Uncharacterized protein n=1 Tax=Brassica napus TaxID=3708 RepID=A0ABQ8EAD9_BRANA|nr:LOW QUALITY PROTEIN: hypothetical protein HID58_006076 [Brassica napus]